MKPITKRDKAGGGSGFVGETKSNPSPHSATPNPGQQQTVTAKFSGTDNPRELRAIHHLLVRPMPREHLDRAVGCSNGPDLVFRLRGKGLELPCDMVPDTDRDGAPIKRGVYSFTNNDRRHIRVWQSKRRGV